MPPSVELILDKLHEAGYKAYIVGGCVRDAIYGLTPKDFDICTSALPQNVIDIFRDYKVLETGIKHGTVTVMINDVGYEVTTFRTDGAYTDGRHPDNVTFVADVKEDLARRDFTINAMAYNKDEGLIDPFDGIMDLENGIVRCVGNPNERFQEDALRMLRGVRFAAKYGFAIENRTLTAIRGNASLMTMISHERVYAEVEQILSSRTQSKFLFTLMVHLLQYSLPSLCEIVDTEAVCYTLSTYKPRPGNERNDMLVRLAILVDTPSVMKTLTDLRVSNDVKYSVLTIIHCGHKLLDGFDGWHQYVALDQPGVFKPTYISKVVLRDAGEDLAIPVVKFAKTISHNSGFKELCFDALELQIQNTIKNHEVYKISQLAINGDDLIALGYHGVQIGVFLSNALEWVMKGDVPNERELLLATFSHTSK